MPKCVRCGAKIGITVSNYCKSCQAKEQQGPESKKSREIDAILLTTETAPNLNITKRLEIVTAETAFGMNIFKDLFAGIRDIVGVALKPFKTLCGTLERRPCMS